jgi:hypothetical protein
MKDRPSLVTAALALVLVNALIWLVLGVIVAADLHPGLPNLSFIRVIMSGLSFAASGVLVMLFVFLGRRNRPAYFLACGALFISALLTIFDDFGWSDLIVELITLAPLMLLIKERVWFLQRSSGLAGSQ